MPERRGYGSVPPSSAKAVPPSVLVVHGALVLTYAIWGGGAFMSKFGVQDGSPLFFEVTREAIAGPVMSMAAIMLGGPLLLARDDLRAVATTCLMFVGNQVFFFLGLKLTEPIFAAVWQVAMPIITTMVAVLRGDERSSTMKTVGIATACIGAAAMSILQVKLRSSVKDADASLPYVRAGHACFLLQAAAASGYILSAKSLHRYPPASVAGWSFTLGSLVIFFLAFIAYRIPAVRAFLCWTPNAESTQTCMGHFWTIPSSMIVPLIYEIIFCSFLGWTMLTWANQYAKASTVSIYSVIQPLSTALISTVAIIVNGFDWAKDYAIEVPGDHHFKGFVVICIGLCILLHDSKSEEHSRQSGKAEEHGSKSDEHGPVLHGF